MVENCFGIFQTVTTETKLLARMKVCDVIMEKIYCFFLYIFNFPTPVLTIKCALCPLFVAFFYFSCLNLITVSWLFTFIRKFANYHMLLKYHFLPPEGHTLQCSHFWDGGLRCLSNCHSFLFTNCCKTSAYLMQYE